MIKKVSNDGEENSLASHSHETPALLFLCFVGGKTAPGVCLGVSHYTYTIYAIGVNLLSFFYFSSIILYYLYPTFCMNEDTVLTVR